MNTSSLSENFDSYVENGKCSERTEFEDGGCTGFLNELDDEKIRNKCNKRYGVHDGKKYKCKLVGNTCTIGDLCEGESFESNATNGSYGYNEDDGIFANYGSGDHSNGRFLAPDGCEKIDFKDNPDNCNIFYKKDDGVNKKCKYKPETNTCGGSSDIYNGPILMGPPEQRYLAESGCEKADFRNNPNNCNMYYKIDDGTYKICNYKSSTNACSGSSKKFRGLKLPGSPYDDTWIDQSSWLQKVSKSMR